MPSVGDRLELLDWKRQVFALYDQVRRASDPADGWRLWRETREELFLSHPQSPIPVERRSPDSVPAYFDHDPRFRVTGLVSASPAEHYEIGNSDGTTYGFTRFGTVAFSIDAEPLQLEVYWLDGYGGGLFLPFRDGTSGHETYGGGRYLLDTVKGADLGMAGDRLVLDFNLAYNPSCSYDPGWVCPLAPPPNHLGVEIRAGERMPGRALDPSG